MKKNKKTNFFNLSEKVRNEVVEEATDEAIKEQRKLLDKYKKP